MKTAMVVGSGASGVHFALSLLKRGFQVTMLDVGWQKPQTVNPEDSWLELKTNLQDPISYFLGENYESVVFPENEGDYYTKYYGFPPTKAHVFSPISGFEYKSSGFVPLISFAQGGLAEAWTGGAYPLNNHDLKEFPIDFEKIQSAYSEVARRIGIVGAEDDLTKFIPAHDHLLPPLKLDESSEILVRVYEQKKAKINQEMHAYLGRSRVTTLSSEQQERSGCTYCGRCLWGCPTGALYTPSITLKECLRYSNFIYRPGLLVKHFNYNEYSQITGIVAEVIGEEKHIELKAEVYILAAGTLSTSKIFMDSVFNQSGNTLRLSGLMDNRQILVPFLNLRMLNKAYNPENYQYHQLAIGLDNPDHPDEYIHGQITTLKTALAHPIIQNLPLSMQVALGVFRSFRSGLGVINLNLYDRRRNANYVTIEPESGTKKTRLVINYEPDEQEPVVIKQALGRVRRMLAQLGCVIPPGMIHIRPMGASVHYSGVLPMSESSASLNVNPSCQSYDFQNLFIVDGSTMPFLPSKNITLTLMANAVRVAEMVS